MDDAERADVLRPVPGLLAELAHRARLGRLALAIEDPRRDLDGLGADRLPELPDQDDFLAVEGDDRGRAGMMNDLALPLRPRLDRDPDQVASEDLARVLRSDRQLSWG